MTRRLSPSRLQQASASVATSTSSTTSTTSSSDNYSVDHSLRPYPSPSPTAPLPSMTLEPFTSISHDALDAVLRCAQSVLTQAIQLLSTESITDSSLSFESNLIPGSSTGKHLRHAHDHFRVLLDALETRLTSGTDVQDREQGRHPISLDYDKRTRKLSMETCVLSALSEFKNTEKRLQRVFEGLTQGRSERERQELLDERLELEATTPAAVSLGSTVGREIWFVALHAIHHLALCRPILTHELGLGDKVAKDFGVAPSTLVFRHLGREGMDGEGEGRRGGEERGEMERGEVEERKEEEQGRRKSKL